MKKLANRFSTEMTQQVAMALFRERELVKKLLDAMPGARIDEATVRRTLERVRTVRLLREANTVTIAWGEIAHEFNRQLQQHGREGLLKLAEPAEQPVVAKAASRAAAKAANAIDMGEVVTALMNDKGIRERALVLAAKAPLTGEQVQGLAAQSRVVRMMREGGMVQPDWPAVAAAVNQRMAASARPVRPTPPVTPQSFIGRAIGPDSYPRQPAAALVDDAGGVRSRARARP